MIDEIWKPVVGLEKQYEVSNLGNIKTLNYKRSGNGKVLKPSVLKEYNKKIIYLRKDGKFYGRLVSRLVAEAFIPNPHYKSDVLFKDGDTLNCNADNLYWANHKENPNYNLAEEHSKAKASKPVVCLTKSGDFVAEYPSAKQAEKEGFNANSICKCCCGLLYSHHGYVWMHKNKYVTNK